MHLKFVNSSDLTHKGKFNMRETTEITILHFTANWCAFCNLMRPLIKNVVSRYNIHLKIINIDENLCLAEKYKVYSVPHTLILKNEQLLDSISGLVFEETLNRTVEKYVSHSVKS